MKKTILLISLVVLFNGCAGKKGLSVNDLNEMDSTKLAKLYEETYVSKLPQEQVLSTMVDVSVDKNDASMVVYTYNLKTTDIDLVKRSKQKVMEGVCDKSYPRYQNGLSIKFIYKSKNGKIAYSTILNQEFCDRVE